MIQAGDRPYRAIIFNADDFGLSPGLNAGIVQAHRYGVVRSASLMVAAPAFAEAVDLARAHPELDLGIHLALTAVRPVLPARSVASLVDRDGRFPRLGRWLVRLVFGALEPGDIRQELVAQMERALATGLRFTHLDSHHHVHLFAPVREVVAELARSYGIPFVRRIARRCPQPGLGPVTALKRGLLQRFDAGAEPVYAGLERVDGTLLPPPRSPSRWHRFLCSLPEGVTELICHPGLRDPRLAGLDPLVDGREAELRWLTSPRLVRLLDGAGLELTSFAALASRRAR